MRIAVASGKGGTGKTTVAVNLALAAEGDTALLDCDVEEPNCHLFLSLGQESAEDVQVSVPVVDESLCDGCRACSGFCRYHAIALLKTTPIVFPELCHSCGGCTMVCPRDAIHEEGRTVGSVTVESDGKRLRLVTGRLSTGEAMASPVIRAVKRHHAAGSASTVIVDAPPGTSCSVIAACRGTDFVVLATEPTPFGLHDLKLAVATFRALDQPFGVVINKAGTGDERVGAYCRDEGIPVLARIPDDRRIAEAYSRGTPAIDAVPELRPLFETLYARLAGVAVAGGKGGA
jgi:MinD superfamily P-loop ATPase